MSRRAAGPPTDEEPGDLDLSCEAVTRVFDAQRMYDERGTDHPDERELAEAAWLAHEDYTRAVVLSSSVGLKVVERFCECATSEDQLCWIGVFLVEPLLDVHWQRIIPAFETLAKSSSAVRRALSCASLDFKGRQAGPVEARVYALIGADEWIGKRNAAG